MSVETFIGPFLRVDVSQKIKEIKTYHGCPNCKSRTRDRFCNECGSATSEYDITQMVAPDIWFDGVYDDTVVGFESVNGVLFPNYRSEKHTSSYDLRNKSTYTVFAINDTEINAAIAELKHHTVDICNQLDAVGLSYTFEYGAVPYYS